MQYNLPTALGLPLNLPPQKVSKAWTPAEKQTVLSMGAAGFKAADIIPHVTGRTKSAIQAILHRDLPTFKQTRGVAPPQQPPTGDRGIPFTIATCTLILIVI